MKHINKSLLMAAALVATSASTVLARQQSDDLLSRYTNKSTPLAQVDTATADRICQGSQNHVRLVCLADLLKKDLSPDLLSRLQLPYSVADARRWSNFPPLVYRNRVGLTLGEFTSAQLGVLKAMLKEAAGIAANEGYDEIEQILNADDFLKNNTAQIGFASGNFHIALLGTPAPTGTWELYFGGHHLAFGSTYKDGVLVSGTPSFRGVEPFTEFRENGRSNAPMAQEHAAFVAMLGALSTAEHARAELSRTYTDVIVGPQRDDNFPTTRSGVRIGALSPEKRQLVLRAIETYVRDIDPPDAETLLARYSAQLPETYLAYSGTLTLLAEHDYVRIDGPSLWIELSMQPGRSLSGIHLHSVWRDRKNDYGGNR